MTHKCIKPTCGAEYNDDDPDDYYCFQCREINKKIAAEIDERLKGNRSSPVSELKQFEASAVIREVNGRKIMFGRG